MGSGLIELALVILIAALLSVVVKFLRQPLILAYLLAGVIITSFGFFDIDSNTLFSTFSDMGIMFLLFLVGLEINYSSLRVVGKSTLILAFGQIIITVLSAFGLSVLLGFSLMSSLYLGAGLTFSSTIIVVKLLGDRHDLNSFYGKISVGVLLMQDVVAIMLLILLAGKNSGEHSSWEGFLITLGINAALFFAAIMLSRFVFPKIFRMVAMRSHELLFLLSLAWVFIMAAVVTKLGLSVEIAGFLAGVALANSSEHFQIAAYIKPLRDFFTIIFFVLLGSSFAFSGGSSVWFPVLVLSLFVLIIKPFIIMALMGALGHRRRSGFLSGVALAQVSEFSLILCALGVRLGQIDNTTVSVLTMTAIISIVVSGYFSIYADYIYQFLKKFLYIFERRQVSKEFIFENVPMRPIILVGFHRTGKSIMNNLNKNKVLVVDFDPDAAKTARSLGMPAVLGDIADIDIMELTHLKQAKLIICTSPDISDNLRLLSHISSWEKPPKVIVRASTEHESGRLYNAGASYVILPLFLAGNYLGEALSSNAWEKKIAKLKKQDWGLIKKINL